MIRVPLPTCLRVPGGAIDDEVSHDNDVTTEVEERVKIIHEIRKTEGDRDNLDVMNVDGDIIDDG